MEPQNFSRFRDKFFLVVKGLKMVESSVLDLGFLSPDPDRPQIRIRSGKIRIRAKKRPKLDLK